MNKTKVIELATNLVSDTYSALMLRDQSMFEGCKNREKEIIEEAGSKLAMPKVFDEWYIEYGSIDDFMFQFVDAYQGNPSSGVVGDLFVWIYDGDSSIYDTERLDKCINAIMAGDYEVER